MDQVKLGTLENLLDPFAGGGSIPLEAQRLGLKAHASDLNPVAVLINKALIEIPPKFAERPPMNPDSRNKYLTHEWKGVQGLAEDIRYYGKWIQDEAWKRIGHLYPKVQLQKEQGGGEATVIAWLWTRTVKCPNPACGTQMPLARSFTLSAKKGKEVYVKPIVDRSVSPPFLRFEIVRTNSHLSDATAKRSGTTCLACGTPVGAAYMRAEGTAGRLGSQMLAIVGEARGERAYLPPSQMHELIASKAAPAWEPSLSLSYNARHMAPPLYGMRTVADLFTRRQLVALTTFSDLVGEARVRVVRDVLQADPKAIDAHAYADAMATYLAFAVDRGADYWSSFALWAGDFIAHTFGRPALGIVWDYAEANPFSSSTGNWEGAINWIARVVQESPCGVPGIAIQQDATTLHTDAGLVSTDPPYYNNVPYADVSDFFYVWLRHSLGKIYPDLFTTLSTPKVEELVADPVRHGGHDQANHFFEEGLSKAFAQMRSLEHPAYPLTVYYAFKQAESEDDGTNNGVKVVASSGWDTMLEGLMRTGFSIDGTWPIRTERPGRLRDTGSNALASSIVLVCRPRSADAPFITRRDFLNILKRELPKALRDLQRGNIAPVDLAQASIGPGMAVFSRYSKVLESDGTPMRVRTALQLINQTLDEVLAEQEGEYDADTRWAVAWFEQYGMEEGPYGVAETLSKAKNSAVGALVEAGILRAQGGKVRLLRRNELSSNWNPAMAKRLTVWEVTQRLIWALQEHGDAGAAAILEHVGSYGEIARDLAYRLYTICERKKWADEALAYNSLVVEWSDISNEAERMGRMTAKQTSLFS